MSVEYYQGHTKFNTVPTGSVVNNAVSVDAGQIKNSMLEMTTPAAKIFAK